MKRTKISAKRPDLVIVNKEKKNLPADHIVNWKKAKKEIST